MKKVLGGDSRIALVGVTAGGLRIAPLTYTIKPTFFPKSLDFFSGGGTM